MNTLCYSPRTTDDCSLTQQDHEAFKVLNNRHPDIKKVVTALAGKKKKGAEDAEMDTDGEGNEER